MSEWNVRMACASCGNLTVVNLEHFALGRIELLREAVQVMDCGVCGQRRVLGTIARGFSPEAKMVLDGSRDMTWTKAAVMEAAARAKQREDNGNG